MKRALLSFAAALALAGCDATVRLEPEPVAKRIIAKEAPVEQRMGFDLFADETFRQKSVTVHYLVAEDGTVAEVGLSDYATTEIGGLYSTSNWQRK